MKVLSLALIVCMLTVLEGSAVPEAIPQQEQAAQQLPDWINSWLDEVRSLLTFIESINKILWSQQIQPLLVKIVDEIKSGQTSDKTVKELVELLKTVGNLVYIDSVDLVFGLKQVLEDLLQQVWEHKHEIKEFIEQALYTLYVLGLDLIFYVLVYLLPALQVDLHKVCEWIKEILKKIIGNFGDPYIVNPFDAIATWAGIA